ncbi:hypothetical protein AtubIFM54640_011144 [Aspergillus tubingensis]|uniref:3-beta hydroxysteroid dehydrogenase/isomerase family protein n=1 Tax=Aspergillus niger TaxID=5061 RepID=A0A100INF7_ASPNG|nr:3-beta hydroxysteroid dehydrogenase/isomerase family protein [Aspergillus niger]GLA59822.1 hypothetical protein AtubIFM54640_011144 [Aspergillus tubingensis]
MFSEIAVASGLAVLYLYHVNRGMTGTPEEVSRLSPHRWTVNEIKAAYEDSIRNPVDVQKSLPPKQNRRYIVVGGAGFVGSWMVNHLLARGEDPSAIRILDLAAPRREILDQGVAFFKTNIADEKAVATAFAQHWPEAVADRPLTVFHNAAVIRPGERLKTFLPRCTDVNVGGTVNVLAAAKKAGASCLISTSSGSVSLRSQSFWIAPWNKSPKGHVQVVDDSTPVPEEHYDFFSNYAASKSKAEKIVRAADDLEGNFRTGCIRPANGIYGIGDTEGSLTTSYLRSGGSPAWLIDTMQNFVNAENVSIAHLLYEQRLIEHTNSPTTLPNIGGQSFLVTDPNPAPTYGDVYLLLHTLSKTPANFPRVPPVPFLILSYLIEWYSFLQVVYFPWLPRITGDIAKMQPALFSITNVHYIADDSRARKSPEQGGLGYAPPITTMYGMCKHLEVWNREADQKKVAEVAEVAAKGVVSVSEEGVDVNLVVPPEKL